MRRVDATVSLACNEALGQLQDTVQLAGRMPADLTLLRYSAEDAERLPGANDPAMDARFR